MMKTKEELLQAIEFYKLAHQDLAVKIYEICLDETEDEIKSIKYGCSLTERNPQKNLYMQKIFDEILC